MQISAADHYQHLQQSTASQTQLNKAANNISNDKLSNDTASPSDQISISSRLFTFNRIAQEFDVGAISFEQVHALKSELFKMGLISIEGSDAITLATQGQPNHSLFSLQEVTQSFYQQKGNLSYKLTAAHAITVRKSGSDA